MSALLAIAQCCTWQIGYCLAYTSLSVIWTTDNGLVVLTSWTPTPAFSRASFQSGMDCWQNANQQQDSGLPTSWCLHLEHFRTSGLWIYEYINIEEYILLTKYEQKKMKEMDFLVIFGYALVICYPPASASKLFSGKKYCDILRICPSWISNLLCVVLRVGIPQKEI